MRKTIILLALLLCGCAAINGGKTMKKTVPDVTETLSGEMSSAEPAPYVYEKTKWDIKREAREEKQRI